MLKTEIFDSGIEMNEQVEYEESVPQPSANKASSLICLVCGDVATGRHYGSVACNGCKGFFRRTIRRNYTYTCRFNGACQIDKHNRAVCRACRYLRCIHFGMKIDAVQNERDLIGKRTRSFSGAGAFLGRSPTYQSNEECASGSTQSASTNSTQCCARINANVKTKGNQGNIQSTNGSNGFSSSSSSTTTTTTTSTTSTIKQEMYKTQSRQTAAKTSASKRRNMGGHNDNMQIYENSGCFESKSVFVQDAWDSSEALIELLLKSEDKIKNLRESVIKEAGKVDYSTKQEPYRIISKGRRATVNDIFHSLHSQLLLVIEWAKNLKPFAELIPEDQTALLKNFASQHIVLCVAYRSINVNDSLQLLNNSCIPRGNNSEGEENVEFYKKDAEKVMDTMVAPMRFLRLDDTEFVTLKACVLFNPVARGLSRESLLKVLNTRRKIFSALEAYIRTKNPYDSNRIGDLSFFILSPLQSLAKSVSEDVLVSKLSGVARIDQLMEELILEDSEPKELRTMDLNRSLSTSIEFTDDYYLANCENNRTVSPSSTSAEFLYLNQQSYNQNQLQQLNNNNNNANNNDGDSVMQNFRQRNSSNSNSTCSNDGQSPPQMATNSYGRQFATEKQLNGRLIMPTTTKTLPGVSNLSPIHDFEMYSTLSSYVLGGPLQSGNNGVGAICSPSHDVLLSSSCAISEPPNSPPLSGHYISTMETPSSMTNGQIQLQNLMPSTTTNYMQLSSIPSNISQQSRQDCNVINNSSEWQHQQQSSTPQFFDNLDAISSTTINY